MSLGTATRAEHGSGHQEGQGPQPPCASGTGDKVQERWPPRPPHTALPTSQQGRDERWPVSSHPELQGAQVAALVLLLELPQEGSCLMAGGQCPYRQPE